MTRSIRRRSRGQVCNGLGGGRRRRSTRRVRGGRSRNRRSRTFRRRP